ncbi:MAG: non-lysosomal glucosylceramidase [Anaerolineae bacterium]
MTTHVTDDWPVLTHYEGERLREIAFPLGGIGTGTIALGGRAELRDFELFNRPSKGLTPSYSFFALRSHMEGSPPVTRVLEGEIQPPYSGAFGVPNQTAGLPRMRHVALDAAYPFARFTLRDPDVPLIVHLEAFNPLIPLDVDRSSLPIAVLRYVLVNPNDRPVHASVVGSLLNLIGMEDCACSTGSAVARALGALLGGNVNEARQAHVEGGIPVSGLLMRSERVKPRTPQDGTMALVVLADDVTLRRTWGPTRWNRHLLSFWDDFCEDGRLDDPAVVTPSPEREGQIGSIATSVVVAPGGRAVVTFLITWHFPHRTAAGCGWETLAEDGGWLGNYYAQGYADAWDVALKVVPHLAQLEQESLRFVRAFVSADLPQSVKEAALNNLSTLRSQTCFRTADGNFFGFEGCRDDQGCCFGSCTHVWNYEQATAFIFPELARNMRELELGHGTMEDGANTFRLRLPLGDAPWGKVAADGQMGVVMKCYREWQLSGDAEFLSRHWPTIKSLIQYCWLPGGWDADQDGVMEGVQHNTYDIEFFGPNPMTGVWYLGALRAGEEMAKAVGDDEFAQRCRRLFEQGSAWIDEHLFNGEYYVQQIRTPSSLDDTRPELRAGMGETDLADPEFQLGNGCLVDQLVGQYMAHVVGLGYLLKPEYVKTALQSLFRYNFRSDLHDHWNVMRTFALADESALLICTWPHGDRPRVPFPYFSEVMTGYEYQAAAHMIYEGMVEEGLAVIDAIRARFDGARRNPWNEQECGHHYARAMASWAAILALSGFHFSAVTGSLALAPRWQPHAFRSIWTTTFGWGVVNQSIQGRIQTVAWGVLAGELPLQRMRYGLPQGRRVEDIEVRWNDRILDAEVTQLDETVEIVPAEPVRVAAGEALTARMTLSPRDAAGDS